MWPLIFLPKYNEIIMVQLSEGLTWEVGKFSLKKQQTYVSQLLPAVHNSQLHQDDQPEATS